MINFATLQGLSIPEGVVTQITDASGRVIWVAESDVVGGDAAVLEVEKVTSDTYVGESTYTNEQFILLNIYPKTNGTVSVTYGGLTKTITDTSGVEKPNAQEVFFGTYGGVPDSVTTPTSGTLTIEGDYYAFGEATWKTSKTSYELAPTYGCFTKIVDLGKVTEIPLYAFYKSTKLTDVVVPKGVTSILGYAFSGCSQLRTVKIPSTVSAITFGLMNAFNSCSTLSKINIAANNENYRSEGSVIYSKDKTTLYWAENIGGTYTIPVSITSIEAYAFRNNKNLQRIAFPNENNVHTISAYAFSNCSNMELVEIPEGITSIAGRAFFMPPTSKDITEVADTKMPKHITLPATIQSLGASVFAYAQYDTEGDFEEVCYLESLTLLSTTPPILESSVGWPAGSASTITVPKGCASKYKAADVWKDMGCTFVEAS